MCAVRVRLFPVRPCQPESSEALKHDEGNLQPFCSRLGLHRLSMPRKRSAHKPAPPAGERREYAIPGCGSEVST
eukprot:5340150-Prymnesium_polylepis.1